MAFDWTSAEEGGGTAEILPTGWHYARVCRIVTAKGSGEPFQSRKGDPQIMVIFADDQDREAAQMYTLSDAAAWTMARLLKRIGHDLEQLKEEGVEPKHFANKQFAESRLVGRRTYIHVGYTEPDTNGRTYAEVSPLSADELPSEERQRLEKLAEASHATAAASDDVDPNGDDIPF